MMTREQMEQIRQRFKYGYAKPCYYDHGTQPAGMFIDHTEAFRDLKDMLAHDAAQRTTIEERDATIATLTARVEELESQHIQQASIIQILNRSDLSKSIEICIQSRDFILQQFCNLQIMYGEQKHKLRELEAELARQREARTTDYGPDYPRQDD